MADPVRILSLYSGSGMLDEAVRAGLELHGLRSRVVGYVEREAAAAALLLARMENAALEPAPVWCAGLEVLDARPLDGGVDLLCASPPCQPYSSAGKRRGNADVRSYGRAKHGPLAHTIRIIRDCRSALVYFENVPEWVTGGHFREFGEELCDLGYDLAPPLFIAAADVGAPHERERVFILGHTHEARRWLDEPERRSDRRAAAGRAGSTVGDAECEGAGVNGGAVREEPGGGRGERSAARRERLADAGLQHGQLFERDQGAEHPGGGAGVADSGGARREGPQRRAAPADARAGARRSTAEFGDDVGHAECAVTRAGESREQCESRQRRGGHADAGAGVPLFPPGRNDYGRWAALAAGGLDAACMPCVERGLSVVADGVEFAAADLLRIGGNGVVPLQAAAAFATLFGNLKEEIRST